jgi:hypothetical protein
MTKNEYELSKVIFVLKGVFKAKMKELFVLEACIERANDNLGLGEGVLKRAIGIKDEGFDMKGINKIIEDPFSILNEGFKEENFSEDIKKAFEQYTKM